MWLDRFSGHSTPLGTPPPFNKRSLSPSSRRSFRPPITSRSASISLLTRSSLTSTPNESTTSLTGTSQAPNGIKQGALRYQPPSVTDPLEVLNDIIGKQKKTGAQGAEHVTASGSSLEKPGKSIETIDFEGLSLEEFASRKDATDRILKTEAGARTIQQFESERDKFQDLHIAIADCDNVLESVESYLFDFQTELGAVSTEIETLQSRSIQLNAKLGNRRNVERLLGPAVEGIGVSPKAVRLIADGPIDENWVKALHEIEARATTLEDRMSDFTLVKAVEDVKPLLAGLRNKAIERIRDHLVIQIKAFRSPNANAQIIQQQNLVKFKDLYSYLSRAHPVLTEEITQAYVNTMRWYYLSNFTRYSQALGKIKLHAAERNDLLGGDPSFHRSTSILPSGRAGIVTHDPFAIGRRIDILKPNNHIAISSYVAEEDKSVHGIEVPFRNFNLALMDNVSAEYSFMTEMFAVKSFHQISRRAVEIFEPVFTLGHNVTKQLIETTTDCLGVLLCVRLNQHAAFELQRRKVPVADLYINGINMQLWPRFQMIMDMHCESLKRAASSSARSAISTLSMNASDDLKHSSTPHFLTQRFGQLLHGILTLSNEAGDDEPMSNSLARLTTEFNSLLLKLSRSNGDLKRRERFLFNNYTLILTIISDVDGKFATEQKTHFNEMLKNSKRI